ncbi:hypothetical protein GCM10009786_27190 [Leucobacter alluvii]|uniref:Uncharacterized protein n=1 Tax=Leucobacter alluvii TaxID=340321 RepID=A0ABP5N0D1_9MICO
MSARNSWGPSRLLRFPAVGTDARAIVRGGTFGAFQYFSAVFLVAIGLYFAVCLLGDPKSWQYAVAPFYLALVPLWIALLWAEHRSAAQPNRIRYFTRAVGLRLGYSPRLQHFLIGLVASFAFGVGVATAVYAYAFFIVDQRGNLFEFPRIAWGALALVPLGAYGLARLVQYAFMPPGLLVDERGLTFTNVDARSITLREPRWEEVRLIQTVNTGRAHLAIVEVSGRRSTIAAQAMGSDPVTVAAILQFYLHRPQHRSALTDPQQALRCFLTHRQDPL